jgi:hypothetical protein
MTSSTISRPLISGCVRPSHKDEGSNQSQHPHLLGVLRELDDTGECDITVACGWSAERCESYVVPP